MESGTTNAQEEGSVWDLPPKLCWEKHAGQSQKHQKGVRKDFLTLLAVAQGRQRGMNKP